MKKCNYWPTLLVATCGVISWITATPAAAQVSIYHMDFKPADIYPGDVYTGNGNNYAMTDFGWTENATNGSPGMYFNNLPAKNAEDPGNSAFIYNFGSGGIQQGIFTSSNAVLGGVANSTFPAGGIDPTLPANAGLGFSWSQRLESGVGPDNVQVAVQTANGNWYLSTAVFPTVGGAQGNPTTVSTYDQHVLVYNPTKTNWLSLTVPATTTTAVTVGTQPASNLTGNITGVGFVTSLISVNATTVDIDFVDVGIPPVPGDVTGDRLVTMADYNIIKANFGTSQSLRTGGDLNTDGVVNLLDFAQWKNAFGTGAGSVGGGAVPEPASVVLMAVGLPIVGYMLRSRKKNSVCHTA